MTSTPRISTVRHFVVAFVAAALSFLLLDAVWLTTMASRLYRPAIGHIMREDFDVLAAAAFYAIYLAGVVVFVVRPASDGRAALVRGALFGLVCYATYDLTNQATVAGWPWHVTLVDLCWGALVTGVSAGVAQRAARAWRG
ncbi:MAG TPA: DUF2177 family protein [Ideonella sp.]|nr:DUF2177 family protein [Ideonella sp.]